MLQKLASWAQRHQSLRRSRELYYMLVTDNNLVAKIGTLGPVAPIFAEMTYTTICSSCDDNYVAKIGLLAPAGPIFAEITWIIICWVMDNNYVAKIGVLGPAFPIFAKIMWIMLQNLASWALRLQYLQRSCGKLMIGLV